MSFYKTHAPRHREHTRPLPDFGNLEGMRALHEESGIPSQQWLEEVRRGKELGLECADSIEDKSEISCFQRGELPHWSGINTFLKTHYLETFAKSANTMLRSWACRSTSAPRIGRERASVRKAFGGFHPYTRPTTS